MNVECGDLGVADLQQLLWEAPQPSCSPHSFQPSAYTLHSSSNVAWPRSQLPSACSLQLSVEMAMPDSWEWQKTCALPKLTVSFPQRPQLSELPLDRAAVLVSAVTLDALSGAAHDVGLEGDCLRPISHGTCSFSSLAFKTTTHNLKGKPLHLLVSLLLPSDQLGGTPSAAAMPAAAHAFCIASMVISPPIHVTARKRVPKEKAPPSGEEGGEGELPVGATLSPFAPSLLECKLVKVEREGRQPIDNSCAGLRAYLSALNIRDKCKHPLFLVLRFDQCAGLLFDSSRATNPAEDDGAFNAMMSCFAQKSTPNPQLAEFVVAVHSAHEQAEAAANNGLVKMSASLSLPHSSALPANYSMLGGEQVQALRRTYCRLHCKHAREASLKHSQEAVSKMRMPASQPSQPQLCTTCVVPGATPAAVRNSQDVLMERASSLVAHVQQMVAEAAAPCKVEDGLAGDEKGEYGLQLMAAAMARYCGSRSAEEIVAFMRGRQTTLSSNPDKLQPSDANETAGSPGNELDAMTGVSEWSDAW